MPIILDCPYCKKKLGVDDRVREKRMNITCPHCRKVFATGEPAAAPPQEGDPFAFEKPNAAEVATGPRKDGVKDEAQPHVEYAKGRAYIHRKCKGQTVISGGNHRQLADPYRFCGVTYCSRCKKPVLLSDVYWVDTGESLAKYRQRMRRLTPTKLKLFRFVAMPLLGAVVGALAALPFYLAQMQKDVYTQASMPVLVFFPGAVLGALVGYLMAAFLGRKLTGFDPSLIP